MEAKDMDKIATLLFKRNYTELIVTEQLRLDQAINYIETQGKRAGIREVVEWINLRLWVLSLSESDKWGIKKDEWQAQLKEWGID